MCVFVSYCLEPSLQVSLQTVISVVLVQETCHILFTAFFLTPYCNDDMICCKPHFLNMQRILKSMNAFIKVVKVATTLQMGSFPGALTEMESHPDELIICISYAETE